VINWRFDSLEAIDLSLFPFILWFSRGFYHPRTKNRLRFKIEKDSERRIENPPKRDRKNVVVPQLVTTGLKWRAITILYNLEGLPFSLGRVFERWRLHPVLLSSLG